MPLDIYGSKPQEVTKSILGEQVETGVQRSAGLFSGTAAQANVGAKAERNKQKLKQAIDAWGTDMLVNWKEQSSYLNQALRQDLKSMREQANQARIAGDMKNYQLALQKSMFDKEMLTYADMLDKARIGDIFTGIVAGLGQLGAGFFTSDVWENMKTRRQPTFQTAGQYQATPGSGFTF